jgi:AcrR family transcriptional regulator
MVQITHTGHNLEMLETILATARKRFGQFGMDKTTMQELADDIGMSKGSIYYYFPDKQQLYRAVIDREYEEFLALVNVKLKSLNDPAEMLRQYSSLRLQHIGSLSNLSRISNEEMQGLKSLMADKWKIYREKEKEVICAVLKMGISKGLFEKREPTEIANLFLDVLKSLRLSILKHKEFIYLEPEEFETLVRKQELLTEIFINGLRSGKKK